MKKIYFASDAHLGNRYAADPMADEKRLVRWMDRIAPDAAAIYFLGDMFDYWYEYRYVVPRGHVRFLGNWPSCTTPAWKSTSSSATMTFGCSITYLPKWALSSIAVR